VNTTTILTEPSQLSVLSAGTRRKRLPVTLVDAHVDSSILVEWAARLNESYLACGCGSAAIGLGVGALCSGLWLVTRVSSFGLRQALVAVATITLFTAAGKFLGLARANRQLRRVVRDVDGEWTRARFRHGHAPPTVCLDTQMVPLDRVTERNVEA
jgi:hypothetical protein